MTESIVARNASKIFHMRYHRTIKQITIAALRGQTISDSFPAVNDVSFTIEQGESVGVMGLNGSGKSTLLKLINGVMKPDKGEVLTRGRIAGLIATGAGFHPQLTGRDNVFLNAAILGMSERETKQKLDAIVDFADVGKFLDTPVGHYSSGMFSRLGFSVAVHTDCDIFLMDEVLAVGDRPFKRKCMARMQEIRKEGRTMLYVSHAAGSVRRMCDRVLVLEKGVLGFDGPVDDGIRYLKYDDESDPPPAEDAQTPAARRKAARAARAAKGDGAAGADTDADPDADEATPAGGAAGARPAAGRQPRRSADLDEELGADV